MQLAKINLLLILLSFLAKHPLSMTKIYQVPVKQEEEVLNLDVPSLTPSIPSCFHFHVNRTHITLITQENCIITTLW